MTRRPPCPLQTSDLPLLGHTGRGARPSAILSRALTAHPTSARGAPLTAALPHPPSSGEGRYRGALQEERCRSNDSRRCPPPAPRSAAVPRLVKGLCRRHRAEALQPGPRSNDECPQRGPKRQRHGHVGEKATRQLWLGRSRGPRGPPAAGEGRTRPPCLGGRLGFGLGPPDLGRVTCQSVRRPRDTGAGAAFRGRRRPPLDSSTSVPQEAPGDVSVTRSPPCWRTDARHRVGGHTVPRPVLAPGKLRAKRQAWSLPVESPAPRQCSPRSQAVLASPPSLGTCPASTGHPGP